LIKFCSLMQDEEGIHMDACLSISNIVCENDIEIMSDEIDLIIMKIAKYIDIGADLIVSFNTDSWSSYINEGNSTKTTIIESDRFSSLLGVDLLSMMSGNLTQNFKRVKVDFQNKTNGWTTEEVTPVRIGNGIYNIIELLDSIYNLALNESKKYKIFKDYRGNEILEKIIFHGNSIEIEYSLKLLWQLTFEKDKNIAKDIKANEKLHNKLKQMSNTDYSRENIKTNATGIIWLIDKKLSSTLSSETNKPNNIPIFKNSPKIVISYNRENRIIFKRIKKDLEDRGFIVLIDYEEINGSSIELMEKSIENSDCVLISLTEIYKVIFRLDFFNSIK
jgi:hypothetical protein